MDYGFLDFWICLELYFGLRIEGGGANKTKGVEGEEVFWRVNRGTKRGGAINLEGFLEVFFRYDFGRRPSKRKLILRI